MKGLLECSDEDAEILIYRLSGMYSKSPYDPQVKTNIEWKGENRLLGCLIRCLYYDNEDTRMPLNEIGLYFNVKGKNLSANVNDYNKSAKKAKEILAECGFINIDVFK